MMHVSQKWRLLTILCVLPFHVCTFYAHSGDVVLGQGHSKSIPQKSVLIKKQSAEFCLEIWTLGSSGGEYQLTILATTTNANGTVSLGDEASAIAEFLDQLASEGFPVRHIKSIYIPVSQEVEVKRRLIDMVIKSDRWHGSFGSAQLSMVPSFIKESNCYGEILDVFERYHLKAGEYSVEKLKTTVIAHPNDKEKNIRVPDFFTVFIRLEDSPKKSDKPTPQGRETLNN